MAQLVKTVQGLGIASVKTAQGLAIASAKTILGVDNTSSGGGTRPGTTGLLAWYDFANANDSSGNGYTLEEMNSPTFGTSSGTTYGATTDGTPGA